MKGASLVLAVSAVLAFLVGGCKSEDKSGEKPADQTAVSGPAVPARQPAGEQGEKTGPASARVLVVLSKDFPLYNLAVDGFKDGFEGQVKQMTVSWQADGSVDIDALVEQVRSEKPDAILAVGLAAAKVLTSEVPDIPTVFCMAMHPRQHKLKTGNATGVELEPWPKDQLLAFREVLPGLKSVGIIYNQARTGLFVDAARRAADELGLTLVARQVQSRKEVMDALGDITKEVDALWLIRDATVLTREFFNHVVALQKKSRLPLLAYSPQFVKRGALCSAATTYQQQGKTAARIMRRILSENAKPGDIPIQAPDRILTVNLASAAQLGLELPGSILSDPEVKKIEKTEKARESDFPKEPDLRDMFNKQPDPK